MNPGEVTKVIAKFDRPGLYVWHCHILSHEEHDMMRPFYVGETNNPVVNKNVITANEEQEEVLKLTVMPNPFSSYVTLRFNLTQTQKVSIRLFDSKGSLIKHVYEAERQPGPQSFYIDGSDLSNGIYFCELIINDKRILRKLVLMK